MIQYFSSVPQTLRLNLRTGRQRQKLVRLLSISDRLKVVATRARCDDHFKPKTSRFLDVEHMSPVLDARNGFVLGQYPATSVWLGSAHGLNALMCACSVGLYNAPYVKILSHTRLLAISTHSDQGNGRRFHFELVRDWDKPRSLVINAVRRGPSSSVSAVNFNPSPLPGFTCRTTASALICPS